MIKRPTSIALEDVSYSIAQGNQSIALFDKISATWFQECFVALRGVSGSGKSTLLSMIAGLLFPSSGTVKIGEYVLDRTRQDIGCAVRAHHIGYVFQSPLLISELSVIENVMTRGFVLGYRTKELHEEAYSLLCELGIASHAHHNPSYLSGGEQQRVALARALLGKPAFVIMDEPTAHLDSIAREKLLALITRMQAKHSVGMIIATHDPVIADNTKEVWTINNGKLDKTR